MLLEKQDAHKTSVLALANLDNHLYSSAQKSVKIWNIQNMSLVSELLIPSVKSILIYKKRRLLIMSADKQIMFWDLVGLTKIG